MLCQRVGSCPKKQLEELHNPFTCLLTLDCTGEGKREGNQLFVPVKQGLASSAAGLGRVNQGSTAPEDWDCCSMQIGLFLFLLLIAITQSCACNKLP